MSSDILLVGLPRSGTSWVGSVLGSSSSAEYVREPITQTWLDSGRRSPLVDPGLDLAYRELAVSTLAKAENRRLIKEVNPLLVPFASQNLNLQLVLMHRHPCAVALSYHERGWTRLDTERRFGVASSGSFWRDHGVYQALLLGQAAEAVRGRGLVVAYEDLTQKPESRFALLAETLDLEWGVSSVEHLLSTLRNEDRHDPYGLRRDPSAARDRWMTALNQVQQQEVLAGYLEYRNEHLPEPQHRLLPPVDR